MTVDDSIMILDLAARFMEADAKIKGVKMDDATAQLVEALRVICEYAQKERIVETLRRVN